MALKLSFPFPIFAPPPPPPNSNPNQNPTTIVRFARWGNAHMREYEERRRTIQEIEDDIRRTRRFDAATKIAQIDDSAAIDPTTTNTVTFKSTGTPSKPSSPSIPGKKSKYSKTKYRYNNNNNNEDNYTHPAFRVSKKRFKIPRLQGDNNENTHIVSPINEEAKLKLGDDGVSYVIDGAPFEFKYSYTESPKLKPLKLREPPYAPFGPTTMDRPWTGRKPLPPSKKKLREFDSFVLPPPHKKGVKPVQKPGPYLPGSGPRHVFTREETLGQPLTPEEIKDLVNGCIKSRRQLNMGRDGLTHNMLDNIHAHWKRRRVCKIKCKGVCTVDMDNVCQQLEERTGGKIIYRKGGVLYLFRGRNYNYKYHPRFPLMLWKPITPVYPRLIKRVPEGLTLEEATEMRKKGRDLIPICKLAKNGVYCNLVKNVREAFEVCELARINCQGLNPSDYRKIGAKLKDLVPCVLISFEREHILVWRGRNWNSHLPKPKDDSGDAEKCDINDAGSLEAPSDGQGASTSCTYLLPIKDVSGKTLNMSTSIVRYEDPQVEQLGDSLPVAADRPCTDISTVRETNESGNASDVTGCCDDDSATMDESTSMSNDAKYADNDSEATTDTFGDNSMLDPTGRAGEELPALLAHDTMPRSAGSIESQSESSTVGSINHDKLQNVSETSNTARSSVAVTEGVLLLLKQAVDCGMAIILGDATLDADTVYQRTVDFTKSAPPGPVFLPRPRKAAVQTNKEQGKPESKDLEVKESPLVSKKRETERQTSKIQRRKDIEEHFLHVVPQQDILPQGSLGVDELAKLLA